MSNYWLDLNELPLHQETKVITHTIEIEPESKGWLMLVMGKNSAFEVDDVSLGKLKYNQEELCEDIHGVGYAVMGSRIYYSPLEIEVISQHMEDRFHDWIRHPDAKTVVLMKENEIWTLSGAYAIYSSIDWMNGWISIKAKINYTEVKMAVIKDQSRNLLIHEKNKKEVIGGLWMR